MLFAKFLGGSTRVFPHIKALEQYFLKIFRLSKWR
jgi:hypothetical protein